METLRKLAELFAPLTKQLGEILYKTLVEAIRVMFAYTIAFLATEGVVASLVEIIFGTKLDTATKGLIVIALGTVVKALDRSIHSIVKDMSVDNNPVIKYLKSNGILGF